MLCGLVARSPDWDKEELVSVLSSATDLLCNLIIMLYIIEVKYNSLPLVRR